MASFHLVPIPIAVTLIVLAIPLIPLTPFFWVWVTATSISRGIRQQEKSGKTARRIGRWIGLSIILPWVAILILWIMIVAQVLLTPVFLVHQLRDIRETVTWMFDYLDFAPTLDNIPAPPSAVTPIDTSSLPLYTFTPLPSTSATTIRLLTIHPDSPNAPIRGTISTCTISSAPAYDALSYTRATETTDALSYTRATETTDTTTTTTRSPTPQSQPPQPLLLLTTTTTTTTTDTPTGTTWTTQPIPSPCATALARLRHPHKPRRVWVDAVCVNHADAAEKSRQVAAMDAIYCGARRVVAYVGEAGEGSDGLLEWVNGLKGEELEGVEELGCKGRERRRRVGMERVFREWVGRAGGEGMQRRADEVLDRLERVWRGLEEKGGRAWEVAQEQYRVAVLGLAPAQRAPPPEDLERVLAAFFDRPWFGRLWTLQEVGLPELARVRFVCGEKTTTGARIVHLSKLQDQSQKKGWDVARLFRLARSPRPHCAQKQPCLLDILFETRHLQCEDPRDRIFAVLNIAKRLDGNAFAPWYSPDYGQTVAEVYAAYSSFLIKSHGPGLILVLIKTPSKVEGLPSWSTDWTVPWPDHKALGAITSPGRKRTPNEKNGVLKFDRNEDQQLVMTLVRPRVVRGFFARDGSSVSNGSSNGTARSIENVRQLRMDEVLVEVYPGLALLLRQKKGKAEHYSFVRVCPHALTREGVEEAMANWSSVVLQESADPLGAGPSPKGYLSLPGVYKIV